MTFHEKSGLRYFTFASLDAAGAGQAVLTRRGGTSRAPFTSLNLGSSVGDDPDAVAENRRRALAAFGRTPSSIPELHQVHSNRIVRAGDGDALSPAQADGVVTDSPEFTLSMRFADCVPILLFDPVRRAIGMAHAGWKGTAAKAAAAAVEALQAHFDSRPADILAGIGPCIGPDHYAIGTDVAESIRSSFGPAAENFFSRKETELRLDLPAANEYALREAGVERIERAGICTACHTEDWFSHRAERGRTGRFGALMWLAE
jgi:YfiH family protein